MFLNKTLKQALDLLNKGEIVAIPTETVYGLAADATNNQAIAKIYDVKRRPQFNPLIIHISNLEMAQKWAIFNEEAFKLANAFWNLAENHKPLTLVLPRLNNTKLSYLATAGLDTVAIRIPNHPLTKELIEQYGKPLAAPSANLSTTISTTTAQAVFDNLGKAVPLIIDGGPCKVGIESTIIDLTTSIPTLLRPGGTTVEEIEKVLGKSIETFSENSTIKAPGMLKRHYAPSIPIRLNVSDKRSNEALLGFGSYLNELATLNLSMKGDLKEAAANLFRMMRQLDQPCYQGIAVVPIPFHGLGLAINDRLKRAAEKD